MADLRPGDAEGQAATAFDRRNAPEIVRRPRRLDRRDLAIAVAVALAGAVVGLFLHYANSLPPDQVWAGTVVTIGLVLGLIVATLTGLLEWAGGRPQTILKTIGFVAGIIVAYPFGPAVPAPVTVAGTYALTLDGVTGIAEGEAACDWAAGRARVAQVRVLGVPYEDPGDTSVTVDFYGVRTSIQTPRAAYRWTGPEAIQPIVDTAPAVSADNSSGGIRLYVIRVDLPVTGTEDEPVDLTGTLRWRCQPAPPSA